MPLIKSNGGLIPPTDFIKTGKIKYKGRCKPPIIWFYLSPVCLFWGIKKGDVMRIAYTYLVSYQCNQFYGNIRITSKNGKINRYSDIEEIRGIIKEQIIAEEKEADIKNIIITNIFLLNKKFKWK